MIKTCLIILFAVIGINQSEEYPGAVVRPRTHRMRGSMRKHRAFRPILAEALEARVVLSNFYASPQGSPAGDGSVARPWDLQTALKSRLILPGDALLLRGGTYRGTFNSSLAGSREAPIQVRSYPNEFATLDNGTTAPASPTLEVYGSWTWYRDLEVTNSNPTRNFPTAEDSARGTGINVYGPGTKLVDLVVHDTATGIGLWSSAVDAEAYGNIIYNVGYDGFDRGHGHGIYAQNSIGGKVLADNIIFNEFSHGLHVYGSEVAGLNNFTLQGNTLFNNGLASAFGAKRNILLGGEGIAYNEQLIGNNSYFSAGVGGDNNLGYHGGVYGSTVTGNYFARGAPALALGETYGTATIAGNTFVGPTPGVTPATYPDNTYLNNPPAGTTRVFVEPNRYEPGRANITVYNWARADRVDVDVSGLVAPGSTFEIRDAQNYLAGPILVGTYTGGSISLPTTLTAVARPIGGPVAPPHTDKEFNSFVLVSTPPGGAPAAAPEVAVLDGAADLADGASVVNLGPTVAGAPTTRTFTVQNLGRADLTLGAISLPTGFSLASGLSATRLSSGGTASFTVRFDASAPGIVSSGQVSLATNDPDENPFDFTIAASTASAAVRVIDDGQAGFNTVGEWTAAPPQGYRGNVRYSAPGTGADTATWAFAGLAPGRYRVSTTWSPFSNRATNAPYTILDGGTTLATVPVNQQVPANDRSDLGASWKDLGTFQVGGTTLTVRLSDAANGYVIADAVRIERLDSLPAAPEVQVLDGAADLTDGVGSIAFGTTPVGTPLTRTFTVRNLGTADLTLGTPSLPAGFSLASGLGVTTLAPGASTAFAVRFDAAAIGAAGGRVSFATNDADEDPFDFAINANATTPSAVRVLDDGEPGFSTSGAWTPFAGQGFRSDVTYAAAGSGNVAATWAFAGLAPGRYRVSATWSPFSNRATDAPYTILDGSTTLAAVAVNQQLDPAGFADQGAAWQDLATVTIAGPNLTVRLSNAANGYVIADAIRIERIGGATPAPEIAVLDGAADLADGVGSVAFGTTPVGTPLTRTFTVRNLGTADLTLGTPSLPAGFSLASGLGVTALAPGASTAFAVRFDAAAIGAAGGRVSFATNDADEDPFDFAINANATTPSAVRVLDDGEPGFSTSGAWTPFAGQGFRSDVTYAAAGSGGFTANWAFAGLAPGRYRVSATWSPFSNRATNAPYTILDGATVLTTVAVNQQAAPTGFGDQGATWQDLATVTIAGPNLTVRLSNAANGYVIADAIRVERIG